ncbi:MAG: FtsH protease activity modulator HflK [Reichenbachiella sp.]
MKLTKTTVPVLIVFIATIGYLATGIFSTESGEHVLIERLGKVQTTVTNPGIHFKFPYPIERSIRAKVSKVQKVTIAELSGSSLEGFTGDENLLLLKAMVNFNIKNLEHYYYSVKDVKTLLKDVSHSAMTLHLGKMAVDDIMTSGKATLRANLKKHIQLELDHIKAGINIVSVELKDIAPPKDVSKAFKEVSDAKEKKQRIVNNAEGYYNSTLPKSRGKNKKIIHEAQAQASEIVDRATGEAQAFTELLAEYKRAPKIVKQQQYYSMLKTIKKSAKMSVDAGTENNTYYIEKKKPAK